MDQNFELPGKISSYLRRLKLEYQSSNNSLELDIVTSSRVLVVPGASYDNAYDENYGHDVRMFLPEEIMAKIPLKMQSKLADKIRDDLNECARGFAGEFFRYVSFDLMDDNDPQFSKSLSSITPNISSATYLSIWNENSIRLFISHRDVHKVAASLLAKRLERYGISSFVAHDAIEATKEWRREIMHGLKSMEVMLVFLTDDFVNSSWTNQEIGYALGANIPIISLKLQNADPPGFISHEQALKARLEFVEESALEVYELITSKLGRRERMKSAAISSFVNSPDYSEAKMRFDIMNEVVDNLSEQEAIDLSLKFNNNDQLYGAGYFTSKYDRFIKFLSNKSGMKFRRHNGKVVYDEEIPF